MKLYCTIQRSTKVLRPLVLALAVSWSVAASAQHCRVQCGAVKGSGTLIGKDGKWATVLTCSHVFRGERGTIWCWFGPDRYLGKIVASNHASDVSVVQIPFGNGSLPTALPVARQMVKPGERIVYHGYSTKQLRAWEGRVKSDEGNTFTWAGAPVEGDSGGAVCSSRGELVGVLFGRPPDWSVQNEGYGTSLRAIHAVLTQCRGPNCPIRWGQPFRGRSVPPVRPLTPVQPPSRPPETPQGSGWHQGISSRLKALEGEIEGLNGKLDGLSKQVGQIKIIEGPAGKAGKVGPQGPPGPPGSDAMLDTAQLRSVVISIVEETINERPIIVQHVGNRGEVFDQMPVRLGEKMKLRFDTAE